MTDRDRFLSELKLLCRKYSVTLGSGKQFHTIFGESVLTRRYAVFVSSEFVLELETDVYNYLNELI
jgi:hypothetical protein